MLIVKDGADEQAAVYWSGTDAAGAARASTDDSGAAGAPAAAADAVSASSIAAAFNAVGAAWQQAGRSSPRLTLLFDNCSSSLDSAVLSAALDPLRRRPEFRTIY